MSKLVPLGDRVIVKRIEDPKTTPSGIIVVGDTDVQTRCGEVVAVGCGKITKDGLPLALIVQPGSTVLFGAYSGVAFNFDGTEYLSMREDDIISLIVD